MQNTRMGFVAALLLSTAAWSATVDAQENSRTFQVERFEPMPAQGANILNVGTSQLVAGDNFTTGVFVHFVGEPLVYRDGNDEVVSRLMDRQLKAELWAGVGLFDVVDIGIVMPIVFMQQSDPLTLFGTTDTLGDLSDVTVGDLRLVPKVRLINPEKAGGFGISLIPMVALPTGDQQTFNSDGTLRFEPRLVVDWRHDNGFVIAANAAYSFRPQRQVEDYISDDVFRWSAGTHIPVVAGLGVISTVFGDVPLNPDLERNGFNAPIEVDLGLQYLTEGGFVAQLGGGTGLTSGVGAPTYRFFASIGYTPTQADSDGDGIPNSRDKCPNDPEDYDGFEDEDGCPDLDNDGDGIPDVDDQCPNEAEDIDGFQDEDGCPDPDNDGDGVPDAEDQCPDVAGPAERNGCPEGDADGDGILDESDQCPNDPEDFDGFEDEDGCPDLDNDQDGIPDVDDKCPNEPEDIDGFEDEDGCPDPDNDKDGFPDAEDACPLQAATPGSKDGCPVNTRVRVTTVKIEILEKVFFDTGKATIKSQSHALLNEVAQVLNTNAQITKVRVEGHTDDRGADDFNQKLSEERAAAVRTYLIENGKVDGNRLEAQGFGESKPIADNTKAAGRDQNRRVEFVILEVNGRPMVGKSATIETTETIQESAAPAPK